MQSRESIERFRKFKESESYCRKAIELKPDFAIAHSNLGNTLYDLGKLEEAFYCFSKVIKINPELSNLYNSITFLLKSFNTSNLNLSELKEVLRSSIGSK